MIKEKEQCIKFQRAKAARVKEFCDIEYHTPEDEKAIEEMDDERFLVAWEKIKVNVFSGVFSGSLMTQGLTAYVCIFCMYYLDESCVGCAYGKNHGICATAGSGWKNIKKETLYLDEKYFPNEFFRDLLNKIMEG